MTMNWNEKLTKQTEPYAYQRSRNAIHSSYPRPPQPNTRQPNAKMQITGWGTTTQGYWGSIMKDYLNRRKMASDRLTLRGF